MALAPLLVDIPDGPQGPQGEPGLVGPPGETGPQGPAYANPFTPRSPYVPEHYEWAFGDDFDGDRLDRSKWFTRYHQSGPDGAGTLDQFTSESRLDRFRETGNHVVSNGTLKLVARPPIAPAAYWTSGCIRAKRKFRYGYVETRVKMPVGMATWATCWLVPENNIWGGEIDIVEAVRINGNATGGLNALNMSVKANSAFNDYQLIEKVSAFNSQYNFYTAPSSLRDDFHVVGCLWTPDEVSMYVDGALIARWRYRWADTTGALAGHATLILNLGISAGAGSSWLTTPPDQPFTDQVYEIDYVRVYQRPDLADMAITTLGKDYTIA